MVTSRPKHRKFGHLAKSTKNSDSFAGSGPSLTSTHVISTCMRLVQGLQPRESQRYRLGRAQQRIWIQKIAFFELQRPKTAPKACFCRNIKKADVGSVGCDFSRACQNQSLVGPRPDPARRINHATCWKWWLHGPKTPPTNPVLELIFAGSWKTPLFPDPE